MPMLIDGTNYTIRQDYAIALMKQDHKVQPLQPLLPPNMGKLRPPGQLPWEKTRPLDG